MEGYRVIGTDDMGEFLSVEGVSGSKKKGKEWCMRVGINSVSLRFLSDEKERFPTTRKIYIVENIYHHLLSLHYACNHDSWLPHTRMPLLSPSHSLSLLPTTTTTYKSHLLSPSLSHSPVVVAPKIPSLKTPPPPPLFQQLIKSFHQTVCVRMAVSGFEGFEKRLELHFFGDDPVADMGLRLLNMESLEKVLNAVQCTVVSSVGNQFFDAYVLSESSLFIYPAKIIIKTCGTTQLLKSIRPLIHYAFNLGLTLCSCRYTRGSFIFPKSQPFPHSSFKEEVVYIEETLPLNLCYRKASVMPSKLSNHSWHVFTASVQEIPIDQTLYTIEVCMTELDRVLARKFFRRPGDDKNSDAAGKEMTELTGIDDIIPGAIICDFGFDPCGYSMNGIHVGDRYSTIHVTPEDGFSYASFECVGSIYDDKDEFSDTLKKAVQVFRPATLSVSTTCSSPDVWTLVANAMEPLGYKYRSFAIDEFPAAGSVVFQTFTSRRK